MRDEGKLGIIACRNFYDEIKYVIESEGFKDVGILEFSDLCDSPASEKEIILALIEKNRSIYRSFCIFATNIINFDKVENVMVYKKDHCLELFIPKKELEYFISKGCYILTPGIIACYKKKLIKDGFDSISASEYFKESISSFIVLDTGVIPIDIDMLKELGNFTGTTFEIHPIGIDFLKMNICNVIFQWRLGIKTEIANDYMYSIDRISADYTMVFEELLVISSLIEKKEIEDRIINLFSVLCAPANVLYFEINDAKSQLLKTINYRHVDNLEIPEIDMDNTECINTDKRFYVKLSFSGEVQALVIIDDIMFPEFLNHYKSLSVYLGSIMGLAIANSRKYIELNENKELLSELNATKDKFFSIISHDLRGPLGGIMSLLDFVNNRFNEISKEELSDLLKEMGTVARSILGLLINLLEWSKEQCGHIVINPEVIDIKEIVQNCIDLLSLNIKEKNIGLICDLKEDKVYADRKMLISVIRNLLHNALKYSQNGGDIKIISETRGKSVDIAIEDYGTGIKSETIGKLFKLAENISLPGTNSEKGSGLGLILCKDFVEKNGGTISVESELGKGSKFKITMPKESF